MDTGSREGRMLKVGELKVKEKYELEEKKKMWQKDK